MNFKHLDKINWYRQGGSICLFYVFVPFLGINETIGYDRNIVHVAGEMNTAFFDRDREKEKIVQAIKKQIKNRKFIDGWIKDWQDKNNTMLNFCEQSFGIPVGGWTDKQLVDFLQKYKSLVIKSWKKGVLLEWSDPDGLIVLNNFLSSLNFKLDSEELKILVSPEQPTLIQDEFIKRIKIVEQKKAGKDINLQVSKHVKQYHFSQNTWVRVKELDEKYFLNLISEDLKQLTERQAEAQKIKKSLLDSKRLKKEILKKYKASPEVKNILYMFTRMVDWRDERKKMSTCLPNYYLFQILKRLMLENNLTEPEAARLSPDEVVGWKIGARARKNIRLRETGAIYACDAQKRCRWFYEAKAQSIFNKLLNKIKTKNLQGVSASKGVVRGVVKIIETQMDFKKMKAGDILVSTMTRPEYVPIMKIAGGIVTNEGGITCHAAIISRELGKPCIIGTQTATEFLKDGDLIEVDADLGVIKIIKSV